MFAPLKPASVFDMTNAENDIPGTLVVISKVGLPGIQLTRLNLVRTAQWRARQLIAYKRFVYNGCSVLRFLVATQLVA